ncbi:acyl-ACP--UDP-N-acetylglucosamine O-acyltransferase [Francisella tularensis subsp. novicida]|uniref:Acyl-ACP--UDP-N-acetylglucosamine O-acyltransferase n=3 Tax=Francisella tularensis TaxID=263 RepID=A0A6I4RU20_FRATU|nr:acyl-ACP--UDP-N-acetylglucosamine O-acyltransferase [Francisella tularensis]ABK90345.1 UDP-N-acetylglucosamine acyltransferase [Francisella tularensis subsp. novicida U112]AEE87900.1 Acyl-[acyl-carrier-protein]--UDP-N- acetylglucosamine O-acyltransferase [Francisella cf. novicida Fx1]AJI45805.1 acyl-[acyl-carrier-protein]-UDP-N-acetylglucosamine O-acyltransferase [Francisella tularensis subsp. novicida F6168]AJI61553.1 acyl-[acyl-carrier-protein]-UDP-N-acetylglucosamine O-acyltransferase [Fr
MIHSLAVVHESAKIADSAIIGPFCVIGKNVVIGENTELKSHVTIGDNAVIGKNNRIFQYASIGDDPIDYTYKKGDFSQVVIGDNNIIRECATIHGGTAKEIGVTSVGNNNIIMCYVHIGHDCKIGSYINLVNGVGLAGHVHIDDYAILSSNVGVHQFCRVGKHAFIAHAALVGKDVPPYLMVTAVNAGSTPCGINTEGLKRRGFTPEEMKKIKEVYKVLYRKGLMMKEAFEIIKEMAKEDKVLEPFVDVIGTSRRGILR